MTGTLNPNDQKVYENTSSPLENFKKTLRLEYHRKYQEEARAIDDRLADAIALRRCQVEREVAEMRRSQEKASRLRKEEIHGATLLEISESLFSLGEQLVVAVRQEVQSRVKLLRDQGGLWDLERRLFFEALESFGEGEIVLEALEDFPEEAKKHDRVHKILPLDEADSWGGCVLSDPSAKGVVVDNRLVIRWECFRPILAKKIGILMEELFENVFQSTRELRVP